ncbi:MAG: chemotaxis-specific protein-glutamate methyltransferase CheB [Myxococcota bacterium]
MDPIRVVVVDDSAFARKVISEALGAHPAVQIVGAARDGLDALEKIAQLEPDVVTLDLVMPALDGVGVIHALAGSPLPRIVVVSTLGSDHALAVEALRAGAVDMVTKPTAAATPRLYEMAQELVQKVIDAASATTQRHPHPVPAVTPAVAALAADVIVIGTSTGGPQALSHLLPALPAELPVPVLTALHIPAGYTASLAERLDAASALPIVEAHDRMLVEAGKAILARGGLHMSVLRLTTGQPAVHLDVRPLSARHVPSVDILMQSAAQVYGGRVLAVVLTGMGEDGLLGAAAVRAAGGRVLTEAASSCIVYGMPRAVAEAGLSNGTYALPRMATGILEHLGERS